MYIYLFLYIFESVSSVFEICSDPEEAQGVYAFETPGWDVRARYTDLFVSYSLSKPYIQKGKNNLQFTIEKTNGHS